MRADRRLLALSALLALVGVAAVLAAPPLSRHTALAEPVGVVVVLLLFLSTEGAQLHVQVRRHAHSVSLSGFPLVIGLFIIDPLLLLAARLLAGTAVFLLRRLPPPKLAFNLALYTAEVGAASALLGLWHRPGTSPVLSWVGALVVVMLVDVLVSLAVIAAIAIMQDPLKPADARSMVLTVVISGLLCTTLALMVVEVLRVSGFGLLLLAVLAVCLAQGYRVYADLYARNKDLGELFDASRAMGATQSPADLRRELVAHARRIARADNAVLVAAEDAEGDAIVGSPVARTVRRKSRDPQERQWLERNAYDDAVVIPMRSDGSPIGTLVVTDREGTTTTFTADDQRRLQVLTSHAEVLWANGRLVEKLRHDAYHDELTGLPNRPGFMQTLGARLAQADPYPAESANEQPPADGDGCEAALLLFDLDRFREVNDTLGHPVGDRLLVLLADRLRALVREGATVARLGGDEFAVLLPAVTSREEVRRTAEELRDGVGAALHLSGTRLETTASVGMAVVPQDGVGATTLLQRADVAMYAAKRTGGVSWYHRTDDKNSIDRLSMLADLRRAIEDGDLKVSFQPQYDLATGQVVGFEALARWWHPDREWVSPEEFVAMAELGGIAKMLTVSVLRQSLEQCRGWLSALPDTRISVNLSPRLTADPELPALVTEMLADAGVPARLLVLELTETSLVPNGGSSLQGLQELRALGVGVSVDDFGTGYSSLAYLGSLPVTELKIDKGFVIPMRQDAYSQAIVRSVVDLSHTLDLTVVAEGIEDAETRALVAATGCDVGQGFGLNRPIPSPDLSAWLDTLTGRPPSRHPVPASPSALPGKRHTLDA